MISKQHNNCSAHFKSNLSQSFGWLVGHYLYDYFHVHFSSSEQLKIASFVLVLQLRQQFLIIQLLSHLKRHTKSPEIRFALQVLEEKPY